MAKIDCQTQRSLTDREINIDQWGRVWPCCLIQNVYRYGPDSDFAHINNWEEDWARANTPEWLAAEQEDPNWNSLDHHTLDQILAHPMFTDTWAWPRVSNTETACMVCRVKCGDRDQVLPKE